MGENNRNQAVEPDLNQIRKNKREKLANLQAAGKDPFVITKYDQTHHSVDAKNEYVEHEKELIGDRPEVNVEGLAQQHSERFRHSRKYH